MADAILSSDCRTITVRVPISFRKRGGRRLVLSPASIKGATTAGAVNNALVKAVARAFRWRGLLENGRHATIADIAAAENINESYVGRLLRLTLLAPAIIERILTELDGSGLQLERLTVPLPNDWPTQEWLLDKDDAFSNGGELVAGSSAVQVQSR